MHRSMLSQTAKLMIIFFTIGYVIQTLRVNEFTLLDSGGQ